MQGVETKTRAACPGGYEIGAVSGQGSAEQIAETVTLRSLPLGRDRVKEKSWIIPLTLTLSPEVRGGEGRVRSFPDEPCV